jgi:MoaA/NifB/PqqE/SkfB family radical SAM enzyme
MGFAAALVPPPGAAHARFVRPAQAAECGRHQQMDIDVADKSLMMVFLLEACNFRCPHCVREEEPMVAGYKLTFRQLRLCLSDCRRLKSVRWIHFSGGEPTLWREGRRDLLSLLIEISSAGFIPGFTSNGSYFLDHDRCLAFLSAYVEASNTPLRLYLSIDSFHQNYDPESGRAQSLDNVLECKRQLPPDRGSLLDASVIAVVSKDPDSLLPEAMIAHYESTGVAFQFVPLRLGGRARTMHHLCPDLASADPEDLGAYLRFVQGGVGGNGETASGGERAVDIVLIGEDYYAFLDDDCEYRERWQRVGRLGQLPDEIVRAYAESDRVPEVRKNVGRPN